MRIPLGASPEVQAAFRELWAEVSRLKSKYPDEEGRRRVNAQDATAPSGLVTKRQMDAALDALREELS